MSRTPISSRFELKSKLGEGGMGVVYEAHDRVRDMRVALKRLRYLDASSLYRFKREFRALADMSHPNVITLYELVADGDDWCLSMELVPGLDFISYVRPFEAPFVTHQAEHDATHTSAHSDDAPGATDTDPADTVVEQVPTRLLRVSRGFDGEPHEDAIDDTRADASGMARDDLVPGPDVPRLRRALGQLANALHALHQAELVHRDLKPSNVRVTAEDRVVLMDFGVVAEARHRDTLRRLAVGTPAYMAPEQALGKPPTAAADWYAFGVMLYQALCGQVPYRGSFQSILADKQRARPLPPSERARGVPVDLEILCLRLLATRPEDRPAGEHVLAALDIAKSNDTSGSLSQHDVFVGRTDALAALNHAYDQAAAGSAVCALIIAESGMGKSMLLRRFTRQVLARSADHPPVILSGRCYERESLSYKGLDSVIDELAQYLSELSARQVARLLPEHIDLLARLFPVIEQVPGVGGARTRVSGEPYEMRNRAVEALRVLLAKLARDRPLLIQIDDLQWTDRDSLGLLLDLLRPPAPGPMLLVLSLRSESLADSAGLGADIGRAIHAMAARVACHRVELGPLSAAEQTRLIEQLSTSLHGLASMAGDLWVESSGNPMLLTEMARYAAEAPEHVAAGWRPRLDEVIGQRIARMPGEARALIKVIAVAGEPMPLWLLAEAAGVDTAERERAAAMLRVAHLARVAHSERDPWFVAYHDKVRETAAAEIPAERRRAIHLSLARGLERWEHATVPSLARHWLAAGDRDLAIRYLTSAATSAAHKLAFDHAADLYQVVLGLSDPDPGTRLAVLRPLCDALVAAGRFHEAAGYYEQAAACAGGDESLELDRHSADNLLRSGHIEEGMERIAEVMKRLGAPLSSTRRRALAAIVMQRARLALRGLGYASRPERDIPAQELARIDTLYAASTALGMLDHIHAAPVQMRHLLAALGCGEDKRACRALAIEVGFLSTGGPRAARRADALSRQVMLQAHRLGDPFTLGMAQFAQGLAAFFAGRMRDAAAAIGTALDQLDTVVGAEWERITAQYFHVLASINIGDFASVARTVEHRIDMAERRNDVYTSNIFKCEPNMWRLLAGHRVDEAHESLDTALRGWPASPYYMAHYQVALARSILFLYQGKGHEAATLLDTETPRFRKILVMSIPFLAAEVYMYRGRAALLVGDHVRAAREARRMARIALFPNRGYSAAIMAAIVLCRGHEERAEEFLSEAIECFRSLGVMHMEAACNYRLGHLIGGDSGDRLIREAMQWMRDQNVCEPERMFALLMPGFDA